MKEKKEKSKKQARELVREPVRRKPGCNNCDGTGLVSYKKLNPISKKHEQVKETCVVCNGSGKG